MPSSPREQKLRTAPTTHSAMGAAFGGLHLQLCTHSPFRLPLVTFPPPTPRWQWGYGMHVGINRTRSHRKASTQPPVQHCRLTATGALSC